MTALSNTATVLLPSASAIELAMASTDAQLLSLLHQGIVGRWHSAQMADVHAAISVRLAEYRERLRGNA